MKFSLKAGADVDLLSPDELTAQVDRLVTAVGRLDVPPTVDTVPALLAADAAGTLGGGKLGPGLVTYKAPMGRTVRVFRIALDATPYTPGAPLLVGGGAEWIAAYTNRPSITSLVATFPDTSPNGIVLPAVVDYNAHNAPTLRNGESLVFAGANLPASLVVGVMLQVWIYEPQTEPRTNGGRRG